MKHFHLYHFSYTLMVDIVPYFILRGRIPSSDEIQTSRLGTKKLTSVISTIWERNVLYITLNQYHLLSYLTSYVPTQQIEILVCNSIKTTSFNCYVTSLISAGMSYLHDQFNEDWDVVERYSLIYYFKKPDPPE